MVDAGVAVSKTEAKRLVDQKAVTLNEKEITNWTESFRVSDVKKGTILRVGKRSFIRLGK